MTRLWQRRGGFWRKIIHYVQISWFSVAFWEFSQCSIVHKIQPYSIQYGTQFSKTLHHQQYRRTFCIFNFTSESLANRLNKFVRRWFAFENLNPITVYYICKITSLRLNCRDLIIVIFTYNQTKPLLAGFMWCQKENRYLKPTNLKVELLSLDAISSIQTSLIYYPTYIDWRPRSWPWLQSLVRFFWSNKSMTELWPTFS